MSALDVLLADERFPGTILLTGGPGIGKTTLWEAGIGIARERGLRVFSARASAGEAQRTCTGLIQLLDGIDAEVYRALPAPQRHALEVTLLRVEPSGAAPEPRAVALGFLNVLRTLASHEPLLTACRVNPHEVLLSSCPGEAVNSPCKRRYVCAGRREIPETQGLSSS